MTNMRVKLMTGKNNQTIVFNDKHKIYIILTDQVLTEEKCEEGAYFETNLDNILVKRRIGHKMDVEETTKSDLSPEVDVNIGNLVNEINDYAVGVLKPQKKGADAKGSSSKFTAGMWKSCLTWKGN